jgi:hypothetical protein
MKAFSRLFLSVQYFSAPDRYDWMHNTGTQCSSCGLPGKKTFFGLRVSVLFLFCQISLVKLMQQLLKKFLLWTVMNHAIQLRVFEHYYKQAQ